MNYLELINRFWQLDMEQHFSDKEVALYFYLLSICNGLSWKNPFGQSNAMTIARFGWGKASFDTAKNRLKAAGLIDFREGNGRRNVYQYLIVGVKDAEKGFSKKHPFNEKMQKKGSQKNTLSNDLSPHLSSTLSGQKPATSLNINLNKDFITDDESGPSENANPPPMDISSPPPDSAPPPSVTQLSILSIEQCLYVYFDTEVMAMSRDQVCMSKYLRMGDLRRWAAAFNRWLRIQGETSKMLCGWATHFFNWMGKQNLKTDPDKIHENATDTDKAAGFSGKGATAGTSSTVRSRGSSIDEVQSLKRNRGAVGEERTEFTDVEVVE